MKLAVIFPGIGYHEDKPLLYYSKKIAKEYGFEIISVNYGGFESSIKGNSEKMMQAFESALSQSDIILKDVDFSRYEKIVFISKSIGTAVAGAYANKHELNTYNIYYTPVEQSFKVMSNEGIIFHGSDDPWIKHEVFLNCVSKNDYVYYIIDKANHSLETKDSMQDLSNMNYIMGISKEYISRL